MKRLAPVFLPLTLLIAATPLAAKDSKTQFNTIVVRHFVNVDGMNQSQEFVKDFADTLSSQLLKLKLASRSLERALRLPMPPTHL